MSLDIQIFQGIQKNLRYADFNIIIDVIRAFTVSYYAFKNGIDKIILVNDEKKALAYKKKYNYLSSGEIKGYKIDGFDFSNSPYEIYNSNIKDKILVQKTTNGVNATINALNAEKIFVTGYVNIWSLIRYIKYLVNRSEKSVIKINIIASNKTGDDDMVCAEYIKNFLLFNNIDKKELDEKTIFRIINSEQAQKFLDLKNIDFSINDLVMALSLEYSPFVMEVINNDGEIIIIKKENRCLI